MEWKLRPNVRSPRHTPFFVRKTNEQKTWTNKNSKQGDTLDLERIRNEPPLCGDDEPNRTVRVYETERWGWHQLGDFVIRKFKNEWNKQIITHNYYNTTCLGEGLLVCVCVCSRKTLMCVKRKWKNFPLPGLEISYLTNLITSYWIKWLYPMI